MAENRLGENLIFVCSCGHSGTTLLWAMLSAHSRVYGIPYETGIFLNSKGNHRQSLSNLRKLIVSGYYDLLTDKAKKKFLSFTRTGYFSFTRTKSSIIDFFNHELIKAKLNNKDYICEKTPRHVLKINRIKNIFPDCSIIVLVRNGLDVTASIKERRGSFDNAMNRWINDNKIMLKFKNEYPLHVVRYENLITKPEYELLEICKFCRLEYEHTMMSYNTTLTNNNWGNEYRREQINQPITDRRDRWKDELTADEVSTFFNNAGNLMQYLGYEMIL